MAEPSDNSAAALDNKEEASTIHLTMIAEDKIIISEEVSRTISRDHDQMVKTVNLTR